MNNASDRIQRYRQKKKQKKSLLIQPVYSEHKS